MLVNGGGDGATSRVLELRSFVSLRGPQGYMTWVGDPFILNHIRIVHYLLCE